MELTRTRIYLVSWKICFLTAWSSISVALGTVPQPENVNVISINFDVILMWDPPQDSPGNLTYTASYESVMGSTTVCQHQSALSCDFTDRLSFFGIYNFSVRAELQGEVSQWVNTSNFSIDKNTVIGAPSVKLSSRGVNMDVVIRDPVTRNPGALRKSYSDVCLNVRYWRENETEKATMLQCEQQNSLVLSDLTPRTRYCAQAQINVPGYKKLSNFSSVTCETTGDVALGAVPQPENVNVISINFDVILMWDPPQDSPGNLTYTASYESVMGSTTVCQHQSALSCDFTDRLSFFGIYNFSVRAELQGEVSQWVNTSNFSIDKNTVIGAPSVKLSSRGVNMDVVIRDPVTRNPGALRKSYSDVCLNVRYWRENETEKATMLQCEQQNSLVLSDLTPRTRYCAQAQINVPGYKKLSDFSSVTCETTGDESVTAGFIAVTMVISLLVVAGTVLLLFFIGWYGYKRVKYMFPKVKMPEHFKEFLLDPPNSHILQAMQNSPQPEERCHDVCILQEAPESTDTGSRATL